MVHQRNSVQIVLMHDDDEILEFAKAVGISEERARYVESMRDRYLGWEHDYVQTPVKKKKRTQIHAK